MNNKHAMSIGKPFFCSELQTVHREIGARGGPAEYYESIRTNMKNSMKGEQKGRERGPVQKCDGKLGPGSGTTADRDVAGWEFKNTKPEEETKDRERLRSA